MMEVTSVRQPNTSGEIVTLKKGIDPFDHVTISSACQTIYRELFLDEEYETYLLDRRSNETVSCRTKFENGTTLIRIPDGDWVAKKTIDSENYGILKTVFVKSPIALVPSQGNVSNASIQRLEWKMELARRVKDDPFV